MHKWKENEFGKHFGKMIPKSLQIGPKIGPKLVLKVQNGQKMVQNSPKNGVCRRVHGVCRRVPACAWRVPACARVCRRVHFSTTPNFANVFKCRNCLRSLHHSSHGGYIFIPFDKCLAQCEKLIIFLLPITIFP